VEWDVSSHIEGTKLWDKAVKADGGRKCRNYCDLIGEPLIKDMVVGLPEDELTAVERQELGILKLEYEKAYLKRWNDSGIDALIMPVMPWVNYPPKVWVKSKQWLGYSAHWNFVNYSCLTIPVTTVNPDVDSLDALGWRSYEPRNPSDEFNHRQCKSATSRSLQLLLIRCADDPELVKGMPVSLQIITGRFAEEKAVGIAKLVAGFT
jgi:amidase